MSEVTAFIHITDLHFSERNQAALIDQVASLAESVKGYDYGATKFVLLITGDVAYAGKKSEYESAQLFVDNLVKELIHHGADEVVICAAPGNHDCDFSWEHSAARDEIILAPTGGVKNVEFCLGVQSHFREWAGANGKSKPKHPLVHEYEIPWIRGLKVWSINTAWCSQKKENCGRMVFPDSLFDLRPDPSDTVIAIMHHPVGWFDPETQRKLQRWLAGHFHFALFGHEHEGDTLLASGFGAEHRVIYRLGQCFGPHDQSESSGYTLYVLDEAQFSLLEIPFLRVRSGFLPQEEKMGSPLSLRRPLRPVDLWFDRHFYEDFLNDLGCTLRHPKRAAQLALDEIFVFPQLRERDWRLGVSDDSKGLIVRSELIDEILKAPLTLVLGGENSGLTTLAKVCAIEVADKGNRVVYVPADKVNLAQKTQAQSALERLVRDQTRGSYGEFFASSERGGSVAIVDGFDAVPPELRLGTLEGLQARFDHIVIFARNVIEIDSLLSERALSKLMGSARGWSLLPVGMELRGEMIRKWLVLGTSVDEPEAVARANCTIARRTIDQLMGRYMLPKVPISVLLILQQLEALRDNRSVITDGSHGFFVQAIAADAMKSEVKCVKIDAAVSFLCLCAQDRWNTGASSFDKRDVRRLHVSYQQLFLNELPLERLLFELVNSGILRCRQDENGETVFAAFRYDYWYHFFLARQVSMTTDEWSDRVFRALVASVHTEESSSTLSFISHFSPGTKVLDALVEVADHICANESECDLAMCSAWLSDLHKCIPKPLLLEGDPNVLDSQRDRELDRDAFGKESVSTEDAGDDASDTNRAFKTIQVIGQILRASSGSITGNHKLRLIEASISLVRRLLNTTLTEIHRGFPELVSVAKVSYEQEGLDSARAEKAAKAFIGASLIASVIVAVERLSTALGARDLNLVYSRYLQIRNDKTSRLVLLAMKMEYLPELPESELDDFLRGLRDQEVIPKRVLQLTMVKRLNLFHHSHQDRRKFCSKLGIAQSKVSGPSQLALFGTGR